MANGDMEDCSLEEEVDLAMDEILQKEKDYKQLIEVTTFLFERSQDLQIKSDEMSNQLQIFMMDQARLEEEQSQNLAVITTQKTRLEQMERINFELERQTQEQIQELNEMRGEQRKYLEEEAV